jgi:hypothetical protein
MFDFFNSWQQTTHSTRIMGGLRVLRGAAAFGAGALSCKASFGLACGLVGMPLMYLGADEMVAGGKQVGSGAYEDTGVRHYGGATAGTIQQYIIFGAGMYGMGAQVLNMMRASGAFGAQLHWVEGCSQHLLAHLRLHCRRARWRRSRAKQQRRVVLFKSIRTDRDPG